MIQQAQQPTRPEGIAVPEPPKVTSEPVGYEDYPPLREFLSGDGIPGYTYVFVAAKDMVDVREKWGFKLAERVDPFRVRGVPTVLMCKGKRASPGVDAAALPVVVIDKALDELTGLALPGETNDGKDQVQGNQDQVGAPVQVPHVQKQPLDQGRKEQDGRGAAQRKATSPKGT